MKNIIEILKQRQNRPVLVIAGLMLVYLCLFAWPNISPSFWRSWYGFYFLFDNGFSQLLIWSFLELLLVLVGVAIWILSIFTTWAAYRKSRKNAYIFILAYFLLPLALQPAARLIKHYHIANRRVQNFEQHCSAGELYWVCPEKYYESDFEHTIPPPVVDERQLTLPIGDFLLLAGVWCLYKKEKLKDYEPSP